MTYPKNLKVVSRKLTDNIVISSTAFLRSNKFNFGARMALFNYGDDVVVWSAIPYGKEVEKALNLLTGKDSAFNVKYLIVPDVEHTLAAKSFKTEYPDMKIIAPHSVDLGDIKIDYSIDLKYGNKLINKEVLHEIGIHEPAIVNNFEFVFLPSHHNKELVTFDLNSKILFEADLLFNLGVPGTTSKKTVLEQYSPETGFVNYNPHSGWSFLTRFLQPNSKVGNYLINKITNTKSSKEGLQAILGWDFEKIVMCHGNIIDKNAKESFKHVFKL